MPRQCNEKLQTIPDPLIGGKYTIVMYIDPLWRLLDTHRGPKMDCFTEEKPSLGEKLLTLPGHQTDNQSTTGPSGWIDNADMMHSRPSSSLSRTKMAWFEKATMCIFGLLYTRCNCVGYIKHPHTYNIIYKTYNARHFNHWIRHWMIFMMMIIIIKIIDDEA